LTSLTSHIIQSLALPIVGTVRAGHLQLAIEDVQGYFAVDRGQVKGEGCFFLRVKGDFIVGPERDVSIVGKVTGIYRQLE